MCGFGLPVSSKDQSQIAVLSNVRKNHSRRISGQSRNSNSIKDRLIPKSAIDLSAYEALAEAQAARQVAHRAVRTIRFRQHSNFGLAMLCLLGAGSLSILFFLPQARGRLPEEVRDVLLSLLILAVLTGIKLLEISRAAGEMVAESGLDDSSSSGLAALAFLERIITEALQPTSRRRDRKST